MRIQERKIIIISIIALVVAGVTYGLLDSSGTFDSNIGKFGGAIAGFLATAIILNKIYGSYIVSETNETDDLIKSDTENIINEKAKSKEEVNNIKETTIKEKELSLKKQFKLVQDYTEKPKINKNMSDFFSEYDKADKEIEDYGLEFSRVLHKLANDLNTKEQEKISDISSSLETHAKKVQRLKKDMRISPSSLKEEDLTKMETQIRRILNDFRHGDIIKKF